LTGTGHIEAAGFMPALFSFATPSHITGECVYDLAPGRM
jgi:hypothetical protein